MKRVLVLVEGQTEERFIKDVLREHLWTIGVDIQPKIVTTKIVKRGPDFKGGINDYRKVERDLRKLLGDSGATAVTTFVDYYGLPQDFPGISTRPQGPPLLRASHVESKWEESIQDFRFRAYLMIHEFEAFLFVKPEETCKALHRNDAASELASVRSLFRTPEDIDDSSANSPSKRILRVLADYHKTIHGPLVTRRVGLENLRFECPHFGEWLEWLEGFSKS